MKLSEGSARGFSRAGIDLRRDSSEVTKRRVDRLCGAEEHFVQKRPVRRYHHWRFSALADLILAFVAFIDATGIKESLVIIVFVVKVCSVSTIDLSYTVSILSGLRCDVDHLIMDIMEELCRI